MTNKGKKVHGWVQTGLDKKSLRTRNLFKNWFKSLIIIALALAVLFSCSRTIVDTTTQVVDRERVIEVLSDDPTLDSLVYEDKTFATGVGDDLGTVLSQIGFPLRDFALVRGDDNFPHLVIDELGRVTSTQPITNYQELNIRVRATQDIQRLRPDLRDESLTNDLVVYISDGVLVYTGASRIQFNKSFRANPFIKPGYSLTNYQLSYTTHSTPADGVNSIYQTGVQEQPTINRENGVITFPAGYRVGYGLRVTVTAGIEQITARVDQDDENLELNPGDEVEVTFTYLVNDDGNDNDGDGINDGFDLDIDGDGLANLVDPRIFSTIIPGLDIAFVMDGSRSITVDNFVLIRNWIKGMMSSLQNIDLEQIPAKDLQGFSTHFHVMAYDYDGDYTVRSNGVSTSHSLHSYQNNKFNFKENLTLPRYLAGVDEIDHPLSSRTYTAAAMRAVIDVAFLGNSVYTANNVTAGTIISTDFADVIGAGIRPRQQGDPETGAREGVVKIIIVLTDGLANDSGDYVDNYTYAVEKDVNIIAIGLPNRGGGFTPSQADALCALGTGHATCSFGIRDIRSYSVDGNQVVFFITDFSNLDDIRESLLNSIAFIQQAD